MRANRVNFGIKALSYKQLIRPLLSYAYPIWFDISSSQMERIRLHERKCLRACTNYRRPIGDFRHVNNSILYRKADVPRIDSFLLKSALKFYEKVPNIQNDLIKTCVTFDNNYLNEIINSQYKPPYTLTYLYKNNHMINDQEQTVYYHRRNNQINHHILNTVYNVRQ